MYLPILLLKGVWFVQTELLQTELLRPFGEHTDISVMAINLGVELLDYRVYTYSALLDTASFSKWFYESSVGYGAYQVLVFPFPFILSFLLGLQWYHILVFICIFLVCIARDAHRDIYSNSASFP